MSGQTLLLLLCAAAVGALATATLWRISFRRAVQRLGMATPSRMPPQASDHFQRTDDSTCRVRPLATQTARHVMEDDDWADAPAALDRSESANEPHPPAGLIRHRDMPTAKSLIDAFLQAHGWEEWRRDERAAHTQGRRPPTIYELLEQDVYKLCDTKPADPDCLGMVKFTPEGDCITLETHTPLSAVAWELERLLEREGTPHHPPPDASKHQN